MTTFHFPFTVTISAADAATAKATHDQIKSLFEASGIQADVRAISDNPERSAAIVGMAQKMKCIRDGEIEVDDKAIVCESDDNGAYVGAWVWVSFSGTDLDKDVIAVVEAALNHAHDNDYRPGEDDADMLETAIGEACTAECIDLSDQQIDIALRLMREQLRNPSAN